MANKIISLTPIEEKALMDILALDIKDTTRLSKVMRGAAGRIFAKLGKPHKKIMTSSAKAKGRNLQKWTAQKIAELFNYRIPDDKDESLIKSREMGQAGVDVVLYGDIKKLFPFAIECKACEQVSLNQFLAQAKANVSDSLPNVMLVIKNKTIPEPLICIEWKGLMRLFNN